MLRPALDAAVAVARAGLIADPPEPAPKAIRPVLRFARLNGPALLTVQRALERDDGFRARVAAEADEPAVGRPAWLWLARPDGWEAELDGLVGEVQAADDEAGASRQAGELREAVARLEAAATAAAAHAARVEAERDEAQAQLAVARDGRERAEDALAVQQAEVTRLTEERTRAVRRMKELEAADAQFRGERRRDRARIRELEAEVARLGGPAAPPAPVADPIDPPDRRASIDRVDLDALGAAVGAAEAAVAALGPALAAAREAMGDGLDDRSPPEGGGDRAPARPRRTGPERRRPVRLPPPMVDDSAEAVQHLLRLPEAVLLVDGYNISMAAWPGVPITDQRLRLVDALRELHARTRVRVVVVFDGAQAGRRAPGVAGREVRVLFTGAEQIADDRIVELVDDAPPGHPVIVATSDRELQARVRTAGANVVAGRPFLGAIGR